MKAHQNPTENSVLALEKVKGLQYIQEKTICRELLEL